MATAIGILHLRPRPPSHAAPSATLPTSRLLCNSRSSTFLPPLPYLKMQMRSARLRLGSGCASGCAFELSPEEDADTRTLRFREEMDKFDRKYGEGTALRALGANSRQDAMLRKIEATLFRDEEDRFCTCTKDILPNLIIEYDEAGELANMVSSRAAMAIRLSARITANAHMKVDGSSEMSADTVKQIIRVYMLTFIKAAEDASHGKFDRAVIISFLDALGGLAAISHILFEDTLAVVNNTEDSSLYYSPGYDVEALNHELQRNIKKSVTRLTTAPKRKAYQLSRAALCDATSELTNFVILVTNLRKKALIHVVRARAVTVRIEETNNIKDDASVVKDPESCSGGEDVQANGKEHVGSKGDEGPNPD